ncbi:MAG: hypothetical protein Q9163_003099 [Psora crenata]
MAPKIVVIGAIEGRFDVFEKLSKLHAKNSFSLGLIVGDLFQGPGAPSGEIEDALTSLLDGGINVPMPTYFTLGRYPLPEKVQAKLEDTDGELCSNLYFLGKRCMTKTSEGLRIVALGGALDTELDVGLSTDKFLPYHTVRDAKVLHGANSTDILVTTHWPSSIRSHSSVRIPDGAEEPPSEQCIADLCSALKPRYHFSNSPQFFYEREPFSHMSEGAQLHAQLVTRFISVAAYDNPPKQKWLYAFSMDPSSVPLTTLPPGTTATPFVLTSKKRQRLEGQEESYQRFSRHEDGHAHHMRPYKRARKKGSPPGPQECFFCLSNPNLAAHLITSIGSDSYLTTAKGPLTTAKSFPPLTFPAHILIIPLSHSPTFRSMESAETRVSTYKEMNHYRHALQSLVASVSRGSLGAVTWEISRAENIHIHWQFVPVSVDLIIRGLVEAAFKVEAENDKYPAFVFKNIGDASGENGDYLRVRIWKCGERPGIIPKRDADEYDDVGKGGEEKSMVLHLKPDFRFDLQFPRRVMAKLLGLEGRMHWKDCAQDEAEEKREAEAFKAAFKAFDFSLEEGPSLFSRSSAAAKTHTSSPPDVLAPPYLRLSYTHVGASPGFASAPALAKMTKKENGTTKRDSERKKNGSSHLPHNALSTSSASSRNGPQHLQYEPVNFSSQDPSRLLGGSTFFSEPEVDLDSGDETKTARRYREDVPEPDKSNSNSQSRAKHAVPAEARISHLAPGMSEDPPILSNPEFHSDRFFGNSQVNIDMLPNFRYDNSRTAQSEATEHTKSQADTWEPSTTSETASGRQVPMSKPDATRTTPYRKVVGPSGENGRQSSQSSETSIPSSLQLQRETTASSHHGSMQSLFADGRPLSPGSPRPRTPLTSSDVTPWLFQDFKDVKCYGDAPVRQKPVGPDKQRYAEEEPAQNHSNHHHHRIYLPVHRHNRSREEPPRPPPKEPVNGNSVRPVAPRQDSANNIRMLRDTISSPMSSRNTLPMRGTSPTPSSSATSIKSIVAGRSETMPGQRSPADAPSSGKRTLLHKLRRHKADRAPNDSLNNLSGSTSSLQHLPSNESSRNFRNELGKQKSARQGSVATFDSGSTAKASDHVSGDAESPVSRKESAGSRILHSHGKFPKPKRGFSYENNNKDAEKTRNGSVTEGPIFTLDTNLDDMEGIVAPNAGAPHVPHGGVFARVPSSEEPRKELREADAVNCLGSWDAPDSWAVKRVGDENLGRLREIDEAGVPPQLEDDGTRYGIRIFRIDSTFATLSESVNTTASEILQILGRKSFLQDDLDNYQIIMRKHDLHRQLAPGERPIAIQKKLLEQAGYQCSDKIDEIGGKDNSYLVRFTFVPTKLTGYYSLEKEPGQGKLQKFSHVDLQGRSLVTIPITLYQKATEIVSLNLSRNLALDVPKDFIQSCNNLREIRYISNEAWQLPSSLCLATRLTVLDISNNRLEQLEHAELDKLPNLASIKISNNKLRHLPSYFGQFKALRSLNISSNYLDHFPDFLCDLNALVDLDISFNTIKALPKLGQLTTLERLWATNNMLSGTFSDQFTELRNLKEVDIRFNGITSVDVFATLPKLEQLMVGHNIISKFEGSFERLRILHMDHNPITRFDFKAPVSSLTSLNLASCKLAQLDDSCFERMRNVTKLSLDKNHFSSLSVQICKLQKLEYLSISKNTLNSLPATIGGLTELRFLDIRECNLKKLPPELWFCYRLDTLNVSSNVLETFPKPPTTAPVSQPETQTDGADGSSESSPIVTATLGDDEVSSIDSTRERRPSQVSAGLLSVGNSPASGVRNGSIVSVYGQGGRKASVISRTNTNGTLTPTSRKDSNLQQKYMNTFAASLRHLYLADNRLTDDVFDEITLLPCLRIVNLSYNELYDIPPRSLRRWPELNELYLSGNELTSLPSDDLEQVASLKVLHINGNKFQVLPAELGKVHKLAILDVGSNALKYNVSNWPYDWNWNWNANLKYLNFSGNKRLEIKPSRSFASTAGFREGTDLTNFNTLHHLRVLGLMDVTLTIPSVPDQTDDRRVRTSGSLAGVMAYGMADSLGRHEHLSTIDMVVPKFRGHETETLLGMFDGQALSSGGSRLAKYLHENFGFHFTEELSSLKQHESPSDALRRTFLALNRELATVPSQSLDEKEHRLLHRGSGQAQTLSGDDLASGGVATVAFLDNMELYIANVGDAQAMLMQSDGGHKILTQKHEPADRKERERIREAGGYVSRHGKLNDVLEVSRAFGYVQMIPAVMAAPNVTHRTLKESDEMILIASKELWDYMSLDMVVDVARSERGDLMRAAQKLRDLAMAFGATGKIMVMMIGVSDLKKRERNRFRGQSLSMVQSEMREEMSLPTKRGKKPRDRPDDSTLQRLDPEVEAPTDDLALVFTDIKNSTMLWETCPVAMRSAIKSHNEVMRRQLRVIGGYEVKTEGDAFMVSFPTATSALLWCFVVQQHLLEVDWPPEILSSVHCQEVYDADENVIYRGLSVRMGVHWGNPVSELDPVTRRMDYFGPMVNRSARISGAADGGEIFVSSDFIAEIHRALEIYADDERNGSMGSDDNATDDPMSLQIRRELRALSTQGFEVKDMGTQKLKGLENEEVIYLMYPHSLAGRLLVQQQQKAAAATAAAATIQPASLAQGESRELDTQCVWDAWNISSRLGMICSALESPAGASLRMPEMSVLERIKNRGGEVTEAFLMSLLEHQVTSIETCISTLAVRNMLAPFQENRNLLQHACPMDEVLGYIAAQLAELKALKEANGTAYARAE